MNLFITSKVLPFAYLPTCGQLSLTLFFFGNVDSATGTTTALFGHNHDDFITIPLPLRPILSKELRFGLEFTVKIKIGLY